MTLPCNIFPVVPRPFLSQLDNANIKPSPQKASTQFGCLIVFLNKINKNCTGGREVAQILLVNGDENVQQERCLQKIVAISTRGSGSSFGTERERSGFIV